jgi:hypothetical protein
MEQAFLVECLEYSVGINDTPIITVKRNSKAPARTEYYQVLKKRKKDPST